eukprot:5326843-Pleurochrysis_carterae.AAC.4
MGLDQRKYAYDTDSGGRQGFLANQSTADSQQDNNKKEHDEEEEEERGEDEDDNYADETADGYDDEDGSAAGYDSSFDRRSCNDKHRSAAREKRNACKAPLEALATQCAPRARAAHICVVVPMSLLSTEANPRAKSALLLHGGWDGDSVMADTMLLPLTHPAPLCWRPLDTAGTPPCARALHAACVLNDRLLLHGGWDGGAAALDDAVLLNFEAGTVPRWSIASSTAAATFRAETERPRARHSHTLVGVSESEALLFGGDVSGNISNELWAIDAPSGAWRMVATSGALPAPRAGHSACVVLDAHATRSTPRGGNERRYLVVCCGRTIGREELLSDVQLLNLKTMCWWVHA